MKRWKIEVRDRVSGHGDSMPSYELPYEGWSMENPPTEVIDAKDYEAKLQSIIHELKYALEQQLVPPDFLRKQVQELVLRLEGELKWKPDVS